ncbi:hypothetical protein [Aestuariivirga sp.]|uniref:hypothetical protein n=1 Tax=Aestuariivirga sp. TaxID=2650926 RepID=UPI0039E5501D
MSEPKTVKNRIVFYIEGYDPRGPSHYHRLYRDEAAKQQAVNGLALNIGARRNVDAAESQWDIDAGETRTTYRFLRYDDIMRARWSKTTSAILRDILRYSFAFLWRGVFAKVLFTSWPMFLTITLAPGLLLLAALIALVVFAITALFTSTGWAALIASVTLAGLIALRPVIEPRSNAFWLARILAFMSDQGGGKADDIEARVHEFSSRISSAVNDPSTDEVLLIGHSVGTQLAVAAAARAMQDKAQTARLSLLTLGHTIPLVGLQPGAEAYRRELIAVAHDPRISWIDISAAIDSACFPLTDPVAASGLAAAASPKLVSARFPKLFSPGSYKTLKRDFSRAHFQYLMAAEIAGDYDYFLITAGDKTLARRFRHLQSNTSFNRFRLGRA